MADPLEWKIDDAVALREFVAKNPKFLKHLRSRRKKIEGDTVEKSAMTGQRSAGFDDALEEIDAMMQDTLSQPKEPSFIK